jgi:glutamate N-acetyltransferase/amino-acid N-acetyltransferase
MFYLLHPLSLTYLMGCVSVFSTGDGPGSGQAWGCDLSYDYVKINAEYTT